MSWDVYLTINTGVKEMSVVEIGNYTSNVGGMYWEAMGISFRDLQGKMASEVVETLKKGVCEMAGNPQKYKEMNPKNGWGSYDGALRFLQKFYNACLENPLCTVEIH